MHKTVFLAGLREGPAERALQGVLWSRDREPANEELWEAVLEYFEQRCPDQHAGYFPAWLSRTMSTEHADRTFRRLFSRLGRCSIQEFMLRAFGERMREPGFANLAQWAAGRGELALELLRGWKGQAAVSESYSCSQRVVAAGAAVFARGLAGEQAEDWALLQFECLLQHALPPSHGVLGDLPGEAFTHLPGPRALPVLLQLLARGLEGIDGKLLKSYTRKKSSHPCNHPGLFLAFAAIQGLLAHPEVASCLAELEVAVETPLLEGLLEILYHLPEQRLRRRQNESLHDYARRLPPLGELRVKGARSL
jgi:hypothetical protein